MIIRSKLPEAAAALALLVVAVFLNIVVLVGIICLVVYVVSLLRDMARASQRMASEMTAIRLALESPPPPDPGDLAWWEAQRRDDAAGMDR